MLSRLALIASTASTASLGADHLLRTASGSHKKENKTTPTTTESAAASEVVQHKSHNHRGLISSHVDKETWCQSLSNISSLAARLNCASCEEQTPTTPTKNDTPVAEEDQDSYPNFSRHGSKSLLEKYLTREIFNQLKDRKTSMGVTLEDTIRAGVSLPWGADPPRGIAGVFAGDAESYEVFRPLFDPLILERHHVGAQRKYLTRDKHQPVFSGQKTLQRHRTNLNPQFLVQQRLDPDGEYVLYTRMRLARSLEGFRFSPCITRAERRQVEKILRDCCEDWKEGSYKPVMEMSNEMHDDLIQRRILFPDPDEFALCAGTHRDWPDSRGLYCSSWEGLPAIAVWVNFEDHISVVSTGKGGDVQRVFWQLSQAVWALETSLNSRGQRFVEDARLGFLNASPANIGTALRASVFVKLVRLGQQPGFEDLVRRLRLIPRSDYPQTDKRYTGIFDMANAEALGKTEVEVINVMIRGVAKLIELEKRLENGEEIDLDKE